MASAKPINGYPSRTAAVLEMQACGMSRGAIARELGISTDTVSALIHSKTRRKPVGEAEAVSGRPGLQFSLNYDVMRELRPHARKRCTTVLALVQELVEAVVSGNLVDAVLDDGGRP